MGDPISGLIGGGLKAAGGAAKGGKGGGGGDSSSGNAAQTEWDLMQAQNKMRARYADLGLGGSTMEAMDEGGLTLGALAEQNQLNNQSQQLANQTLTAQTGALGQLANLATGSATTQGAAAGNASVTGGNTGTPT